MANTRYGRLLPPNYGDGKNEWDLIRNDSASSFQLFVFVKFFTSRFRALYKNQKDIWHVTLDKIVERTVKLYLNAPFARLYLCVVQSFLTLFPWFIDKKKKCTSVIDIKFSERHFHCLQLDLIRSDARRQSTFYSTTTNNYSRRSAYYAAVTNAFFSPLFVDFPC